MDQANNDQIMQYVFSFTPPAEADFFTDEQKKSYLKEKEKYYASRKYVASIIEKEGFEDIIQKATIDGKIFSASQMANFENLMYAYENGDALREDIQETLVNKTGQRLIMSGRLAEILGFLGDGYILKDESEELVSAMQADGIPSPEIDKVVSSLNKYGAIILQRGIMAPLKSLLQEAVGKSLNLYTPKTGTFVTKTTPQFLTTEGKTSDQSNDLPLSFIEYLKNNDKEYDRVEHEVINDSRFVEFFANLKKHYNYYQNMSNERMAGEVIIREQLWSKLMPQTKVWVQNIVERNKANFLLKIGEIAITSQISKLEDLKKSLGK